MRPRLLLSLGAAAILGCFPAPPPAAPPPPPPTDVGASYGRTWDAAVSLLTERHIGIRTIDRPSGLIVSDTVALGGTTPETHAGCGSNRVPRWAIYTILVRGDSTRSTVDATARWSMGILGECPTMGGWERELETAVKARAER